MDTDRITAAIIGGAIQVHRALGPGLLESAYQACLARELTARGLRFSPQHPAALRYRGAIIEPAYRLDFLVEDRVIVEIKAMKALDPIHTAQVLTYLRLMDARVGLLINFNAILLKDGIRRFVV